jgi:hypothetical protein
MTVPFLDVGTGEHRRAGFFERARDARRSVPVRIRLDDGNDARRRCALVGRILLFRPGVIRQVLLDCAKVRLAGR